MPVRVRGFSPSRLNPMSHIVIPVCLDQLSPITLCNRLCGSGIAGATSQDFNSKRVLKIRVIFTVENHCLCNSHS